jgi:hypothetical protein
MSAGFLVDFGFGVGVGGVLLTRYFQCVLYLKECSGTLRISSHLVIILRPLFYVKL